MSGLTPILTNIAAVVEQVSGIVYSPAFPPDSVSEIDLPAAFIYPMSGGDTLDTHGTGSGYSVSRSVTLIIQVGLKVKGVDAQTLAQFAMQIHEPLGLRLFTHWIQDEFNHTVPFLGLTGPSNALPLRWEYAEFVWGGLEVFGFQYELDLTYREEITI